MHDAVEGVRGRANKIAQISAATTPLMDTLGGIAIGLTVFYAGWRVIDGGADPGSFFSFLTALLMAYDPARRIARMNVQLRARLTAVGIMYDLLDQEPKLIEKEQTVSIPDLDGGYTIDLDGVSFAYDEEEGAVRINGVDLRDLSFVEARSLVSSVTQDPFLFGGTVRRNIELGRLGASDDDIVAAAKAANAHEFIEELPDAYDAEIGADGAKLSGGQRQRIAIARAILRTSPFDNSTCR